MYWVALDPSLGSEIKKTRPTVIVSNNSCNAFGSRVVVLPLTSQVHSLYPGEALITIDGKPARALGDQIRLLDKSRLRARIETLNQDELAAVERRHPRVAQLETLNHLFLYCSIELPPSSGPHCATGKLPGTVAWRPGRAT